MNRHTKNSPPNPDRVSSMDLAESRLNSLARSEAAVRENRKTYRQIKEMLDRVLCNPLEIGDYYATARNLAQLLESMGPGTLFSSYYPENIDPDSRGRAHHLRSICQDLQLQVRALEKWRVARRKLRAVARR